jgi:nucleotide-binding universal stress UspA family protein
MYKFNKILVGLDNTAIDAQLIKAACAICQLSGSKEVFFVNIVKDFNYPENLIKEFPDIIDRALDERKSEIQKKVDEHFKCKDVTHHYLVEQGKPTRYFMNFIAEKKIDLMVVGRKIDGEGSGIMTARLARRASCSLIQ